MEVSGAVTTWRRSICSGEARSLLTHVFRALSALLQAAHPELGRSRELQVFLEAGEQDWQIEQALAPPSAVHPVQST